MKYLRFAIGLALICVIATASLSCHTKGSATVITSVQAIDIAKARVVSDAVMTLTGRDDVVLDEGANWHVSFPLKASLDTLGGEPHVKVAKTDGSIVDVYYTQ